MIPQSQPYIKNYLTYQKDLRGLGNALRVVVENVDGDVFDPAYIEVLKQVNDELVLTPGVDRAWVKSLWAPGVRWTEVTEEGFRGGPVMPDSYNGSPQSVEQLKQNIARSGIVGSLVATNFKSSMIFVPLLEKEPGTGKRIDYHGLSQVLEEKIRAKYEVSSEGNAAAAGKATPNIRIHVIGFAKLIGELIDGLFKVMMFFGIAAVIVTAVIYAYTRCVRSTALVVACSLVAVIWQLGLVALAGFELDPFSILVPFLVFAIGVSHGAQKMNGIMQDVGRGTHKLVAARYTFRRLFLAGLTALLADAVGFAVLMVIDIPVIKELALTASIGVAVLIFTNLLVASRLAVVQRRQREGSPAQPARGQGGAAWQGSRPVVAVARPLHDAPLGARRRRGCGRTCHRRLRGEPSFESRRPGPGRAGTASAIRATTATMPSSPPTTRCPRISSR